MIERWIRQGARWYERRTDKLFFLTLTCAFIGGVCFVGYMLHGVAAHLDEHLGPFSAALFLALVLGGLVAYIEWPDEEEAE